MNAKHCRHSITEPGDTLLCEELFDRKFKTNGQHNRISWSDQQGTPRSNPELKVIEDAHVSILSTVSARRHSPSLNIVVPVRRNRQAIVASVVNFIGTSVRVPDRQQGAIRVAIITTVKRESLLLGRCARILYSVIARDVQECWESLLALLASVSAIPSMIHIGVQAIIETSVIILNVYWLRRSVHSISILRFENKYSKGVFLAHEGIPDIFLYASRDYLG